MDEKLETASKDVLVQMVKLAQKEGMKGDKGDWKDFLKDYDKKFGSSMSDPAKRTPDDLRAFIHSFKEEKDINYFARLIKSHANQERVKHLMKSQGAGSPEASLIHLTLEHPHYPMAYSFPSHEEEWFITKLGKKAKGKPLNTLLAVDCEMVLCEDGTEALVKICVVDRDLKIKLHEFVKPTKPVVDYRTPITGVSEKDLEGITLSVKDIQKSLRKLLSRGEILVGHSLSNDLQAMKVDHARVIDTSFIYKYGDEFTKRRPSLNDLCRTVLGYELRKKGASHNCVDDACAAMKLVLAKMGNGLENVISLTNPEVPVNEQAKLLVHRIPLDFPGEELHRFISGDFTVDIQANKKSRGNMYTAFAIFKSIQEALDAYEKLQGVEEKDSYGRPQKPVSIQLEKSGLLSEIYVRKMTLDESTSLATTKRPPTTEASESEPKRLKTDQSDDVSEGISYVDYEKEIERLKNMVKQRDEEISAMHTFVASLVRKQGL